MGQFSREDRHSFGGGVVIYSRDGLCIKRRFEFENSLDENNCGQQKTSECNNVDLWGRLVTV